MKPERDYQALLESLADGVEVDWAALDTGATTDRDRRRYHNLRLVARVAELHRTLVVDDNEPTLRPSAPGAVGPGAGQNGPILATPGTWGHLDVQERIAGGAFGDVYLAHDPHLNRDVALKLLRRDASQHPRPSACSTRRTPSRTSGIRTSSPSTAPTSATAAPDCGWSS